MTVTDVTPRNVPTGRPNRRALFNTLMSAAGFAVCVVGPGGTWTEVRSWVLAGVFLVVHVIGTMRILRANPELLPERARVGPQRGQPVSDKVLLYAFTASYAGMLVLSSADGTRWQI